MNLRGNSSKVLSAEMFYEVAFGVNPVHPR